MNFEVKIELQCKASHCKESFQYCHKRIFGVVVQEMVMEYFKNEGECASLAGMESVFIDSYTELLRSSKYSNRTRFCVHPPPCMWNSSYMICAEALAEETKTQAQSKANFEMDPFFKTE